GKQVWTIYPMSSPDYPVRLFNRQQARFNDRPVDDQVVGHASSVRLPGFVRHDTFYSLHEVFNKLNSYTSRLVKYQQIKPSLTRGIVSAIGAFFKWYLFSGAWRYGKVGVVTGLYAT
ncbi:glycosyltransferase family 2 protein, partial [Escherichia coli]|nr:glycosyltransferase family 2 protein [Escherichia coli]